jgi:hypothetical protein
MILELGDKMSYIIIRHAALSRVKCIFMIFWTEAYVTNFLEQKDPTPEPIERSCSTTANVSSSIHIPFQGYKTDSKKEYSRRRLLHSRLASMHDNECVA